MFSANYIIFQPLAGFMLTVNLLEGKLSWYLRKENYGKIQAQPQSKSASELRCSLGGSTTRWPPAQATGGALPPLENDRGQGKGQVDLNPLVSLFQVRWKRPKNRTTNRICQIISPYNTMNDNLPFWNGWMMDENLPTRMVGWTKYVISGQNINLSTEALLVRNWCAGFIAGEVTVVADKQISKGAQHQAQSCGCFLVGRCPSSLPISKSLQRLKIDRPWKYIALPEHNGSLAQMPWYPWLIPWHFSRRVAMLYGLYGSIQKDSMPQAKNSRFWNWK